MIDVGHPFSKPFEELVDALTESLQLGVEQPASQDLVFRSGTFSYPLRPIGGPVSGLAAQISGFVGGRPAIFDLGRQYTFQLGQLLWQPLPAGVDPDVSATWFPDDNSRLSIGYLFRDLPSGITDFNAGSVGATLVRATARELKLLYEQMDQAYRRAFIDFAQGSGLDNVVSLLGISRNQALPAQGEVTFSLKQPPRSDVAIGAGVRVADARGRVFKVTTPGVIKAVLEEAVAASGMIVHTLQAIAGGVHVRLKGSTADLSTVPTAAGKPFGDDGQTITLAAIPSSPDLIVNYQPKTPELTLPVIALDTGPEGNLGSGSLTIMPTPPRGFDGAVTNQRPLTGGEAAESDEQLRERAKHALERAGNATLNAIRFAVLNIDGVDSVDVRDFSVDETIPLGEVWVRFSTGKSDVVEPRVREVVDGTRAAGIKARVTEVSTVLLSGAIYVIGSAADGGADAATRYKTALVSALAALGIGEPVSPRKLAALVFQIPGLDDVAEIQLDYARGAAAPAPLDRDPFVVDPGEQARPDEGGIAVHVVHALSLTAAALAADGTLTLSLSLLDDTAAAIRFRSFQLALTVTVRAKPTATPNQPLQQVAQVTGQASFTQANQANPVFANVSIANLPSLDAGSIEVSVQAAAYSGIAPATHPLAI